MLPSCRHGPWSSLKGVQSIAGSNDWDALQRGRRDMVTGVAPMPIKISVRRSVGTHLFPGNCLLIWQRLRWRPAVRRRKLQKVAIVQVSTVARTRMPGLELELYLMLGLMHPQCDRRLLSVRREPRRTGPLDHWCCSGTATCS